MTERTPLDRGADVVTNLDDVQALVGEPRREVLDKSLRELDPHCVHFLEICPFLCISTSDGSGKADNSPRGDEPGFVRVLDPRTIVIPERIGNRRIDTLRNIVENPEVAIILFVPGVEETLRLNGRAEVLKPGSPSLKGLEVKNKAPLAGIRIRIEEVFFHCARALKRSQLWERSSQVDPGTFPKLGQVMRDQLKLKESAAEIQSGIDQGYRQLY
jgi:PPOX class probable FMN-dependent enzyme